MFCKNTFLNCLKVSQIVKFFLKSCLPELKLFVYLPEFKMQTSLTSNYKDI